MSFALHELASLLNPPAQVMGMVVELGTTIRVATSRGSVLATPVGSMAVGDRVVILGGMASKAPVAKLEFSA